MTQTNPPAEMPDGDNALPAHTADSVDTLKRAMRRARSDDAERAGARAELRAARLLRLELLQDALQPLLPQIPPDVDIFDIALVPTSDPRLFIDMIGFVSMGRDARLYILQQDTLHGRVVIVESESLATMVDAVTDYVARRLLERDKALASEAKARGGVHARVAHSTGSPAARDGEGRPGDPASRHEPAAAPRKAPAALRWTAIAFAFLIDLLGSVAFFGIVAAAAWYVWTRSHPPA